MIAKVTISKWLAKKRGMPLEVTGEVEAETQKAILLTGRWKAKKRTHCNRCGRELTHPASIEVGFGPVCCQRLGIAWPEGEISDETIKTIKEKIESVTFEEWLPKSHIEMEVIEKDVKTAKIGVHARKLKSGRVKIKGVGIKSPYEHKDLCKKVQQKFGGRWNAKKKMWTFPLQTDVVDYAEAIWNKEGQRIERTERLNEWFAKEKKQKQEMLAAQKDKIEPEELNTHLAETLYDFQRTGTHWLSKAKGAILADDMGLGKTIQTLAALDEKGDFPALVICPASVKENWANEVRQWLPDKSFTIVDGGAEKRLEALNEDVDIYISNYAQLREKTRRKENGDWKEIDNPVYQKMLNKGWKVVVFDEAHKIKNRKSQQTKGAYRLIKKAEKVFHLTGTPIQNAPQEIWSLLHSMEPKKFSSFWRFVERYCNVYDNGWGMEIGDVKNPKEFRETLKPYMLRRMKEEVIEDMPDLTVQKQWVELSGKQKKIYDQMEKRMVAELSEAERIVAPVIIAKITRLKQIAVSPSLLSEEEEFQSAKIDALMEILEGAGEQKIVVFSQFRKAIELVEEKIKEEGVEYGILHGGISQKERQEQIDKFQNNKDCKVFLATIKAGGLGINLTAGSIAVFLDKDWTPANNSQAVDRLHRIGQEKNVTVIELLAKNTIEQYIENLLDKKQETFDSLIEGKVTGKELLVNLGIKEG